MRIFSGKSPLPGGEVDFQTWRLLAIQNVEDESLSETEVRRSILQSLMRPALDLIHSSCSATEILELLEKVYGQVEDGQELLVKFFSAFQSEKESPSDYLQRLHSELLVVVRRGGIELDAVGYHLTRQFIRGCFDEGLLQKLRLEEQDSDSCWNFADLLVEVRREECKRKEKQLRLRKKPSAFIHQSTSDVPADAVSVDVQKKLSALQQQVSTLSKQLGSGKYEKRKKVKRQVQGNQASFSDLQEQVVTLQKQISELSPASEKVTPGNTGSKRSGFKGFCYNCGEDGHIAAGCKAGSNPTLVQEKLLKRRSSRVQDRNPTN